MRSGRRARSPARKVIPSHLSPRLVQRINGQTTYWSPTDSWAGGRHRIKGGKLRFWGIFGVWGRVQGRKASHKPGRESAAEVSSARGARQGSRGGKEDTAAAVMVPRLSLTEVLSGGEVEGLPAQTAKSAPWSVRAFAFSRKVSLWDSICSDTLGGR